MRDEKWLASPAATAARLTKDRWIWADHLHYISRRIVEAIRKGGGRIIITMPPRHGKSELVSHWLPVWFLELYQDKTVLLGSYGASLAASWGRKVRDSINAHRDQLTVRVCSDKAAAEEWQTTRGGGMMTAGVDGAFTGRGGHLIVIDDPIKNAQEANSIVQRDKVWDFWKAVAYTRLEPGATIIVMCTRWHQDDLIGRLLKQDKENEQDIEADKWDVINLPAMAENDDPLGRERDEPLWPERYSLAALKRILKAVGQWVWCALFQGRPVSIEGGLFKREWLPILPRERAPVRFEKIVRHWDLAASESVTGSDPDWTVGLKAGITAQNDVYILDVVRVQASPDSVEKIVEQTARMDGTGVAIRMEQEPGSSGKSVISTFARRILNAFDFRGKPSSGDKVTRAMPAAACAERGQLFLVEGRWNADFVDELTAFDKGAHDDQVDGLSGAYEELAGGDREWTAADFQKIFSRDTNNAPRGTGGYGLLQKKLRQR